MVLTAECCSAQRHSPSIDFTSDTQEPMWVEKLFLKANRNLEATRMIFQDIDTTRPAALFILGDVVSLGKSNAAWNNMDRYLLQTRNHAIPVYATLGNHEVMFNVKKGTSKFIKRFPYFNPAGYSEIIDSVAVILLNSNFSKMSSSEIASQNAWYIGALSALDSNPGVKFVIVGCHHSPFTNSTIVKPSTGVLQYFVPPFLADKKCVLFLSGHSHNFEQFSFHEKYFLVIGGGGGLHQPVLDQKKEPRDLSASYKPMFHYLQVRRQANTLQIVSRQLNPDFSGFSDGLSLILSPKALQ